MATSSARTEQAVQALRRSSVPALRSIHVEELEGKLVLSGRVSSYYYKQLAQETVLPHLSDGKLVNQITVAPLEAEHSQTR